MSIRQVCKLAEVSPAYLSLILSQKRSLTKKSTDQLVPHLQLETSEKSYFKLLVSLSESPTQAERQQAYQKIKRFSKYQDSNENQIEAFNYMSEWYYIAIRELAAHPEFTGNVKWIQKQLIQHVPADGIEKALAFLTEKGFLKIDANGRYNQPDRNIDCIGGIYNLSLNRFHQQILTLASQAIDEVEKDRRNFSGYSFLISDHSYTEIVDLLEQTKTKIKEIENRDRKDQKQKSVYHVELVTIPLTGKKDRQA